MEVHFDVGIQSDQRVYDIQWDDEGKRWQGKTMAPWGEITVFASLQVGPFYQWFAFRKMLKGGKKQEHA